MAETRIERAEEQRDIKASLTASQGLDRQEEQELIFKETSPRRRKTTIYRVRDGQPTTVPEYMAIKALDIIEIDGTYRFTSDPAKAAEHKPGTVKCFLHADSPDREVLDELGLSRTCPMAALKNPHSKRMHALHRHPQEWLAFQEHLEAAEKAEEKAAQKAQLAATLALARGAAASRGGEWLDNVADGPGDDFVAAAADQSVEKAVAKALSPCPEEGCNYQGTTKQLNGHKMGAHKQAEAAAATS